MKLYFLSEKLIDQLSQHLAGGGCIEIEIPTKSDSKQKLFVLEIRKTNSGCALLGHEVPSQCAWEDEMKLLTPIVELELEYNKPVNVYTYNIYISGKRSVRLTTHLK